MNKYPLIGGSICAVVLLVLASLTNVVGYQTIQTSNQKIINSEIDQKELLFQTIVDMVNNKEIQKVILGSEITEKRFFDPGMRFSVFNHPVLTEKFLKRMYTMGVVLFRTLSKTKMQSLIQHHPVMNQKMQKELFSIVQKDFIFKGELAQLSNLKCNCEEENTTMSWSFPIICDITFVILVLGEKLLYCSFITDHEIILEVLILLMVLSIFIGGLVLQCWWVPSYPGI
jgi:hypothetical protein